MTAPTSRSSGPAGLVALGRAARCALVVAWVLAAGACAPARGVGGGAARPAGPQPADIAALEAARSQTPDDPVVQLRLARAYYEANRHADARQAVGEALRVQPSNREALTYLGLIFEGLEAFDSARAVYREILAANPSKSVQQVLRGRLALLTHKELRLGARRAIAREAALAATPPDPNTVAVMPFRYVGSDTTLRPLERGLAALFVTDLSRVQRLRLVERDRLQALLDELKLAETGRVDPATGARSGRLAGAGQVVQGQFGEAAGANFRMDAAVVRATDAQIAASGSGSDQLRALFDLEKAVVLQLLAQMQITLTPAERRAISERPTRDVQAFLLYSRGLEAQDRGDFAAAAQAFQAAVQRDPGFQAAAQQATVTQDAQAATATPASDIATAVAASAPAAAPPPTQGTLTNAINTAVPSGASTLGTTTSAAPPPTPPTDPNRIAEGTNTAGAQNIVRFGSLIIIIRRP